MAREAFWEETDAKTTSKFGAAKGTYKSERRLLTIEQVLCLLNLDEADVQELIATGQLTLIRILGKERIDSKDVDGLINSYRRTAMRRASGINLLQGESKDDFEPRPMKSIKQEGATPAAISQPRGKDNEH